MHAEMSMHLRPIARKFGRADFFKEKAGLSLKTVEEQQRHSNSYSFIYSCPLSNYLHN